MRGHPSRIVPIALIAAAALIAFLVLRCGSSGSVGTTDANDEPLPWIDTHAHPLGISTSCTTQTCLDAVVVTMDTYGVRWTILLSPPAGAGGVSAENEAAVRTAVSTHTDRFFYAAGGAVLNPLIQRQPDSGDAPAALTQDFDTTAQGLIDAGNLVAFGETAALHLSYSASHPFEETPANGALFLRLAGVAATNNIPIDIHMDAVRTTMATPSYFTSASPNNPAEIQGNVDAFEALLNSNPNARIVWAHVGRDTTRDMSAELVGPLLAAHPNLYIQIHPVLAPLHSPTTIVDATGTIRPEWLSLLQAYPDRAVMGSDTFYAGTSDDGAALALVQAFLKQLSSDLADRIGCSNPVAIYRLSSGC